MKSVIPTRLYSKLLILFIAIYSQSILANNEILLKHVNDQQHALSEYVGKGQWTCGESLGRKLPTVPRRMPELVLLHDEYHQSLVSVLGIVIDFPSFSYPDKTEINQFLQ